MAGLLDGIDQRTNLVGENRLELLLFRLGARQRYGINVFKIQEVIQCPPLTKVANSNPIVRGIANMRGKTIPIMDLAQAIGKRPVNSTEDAFVIVTEYNRSTQGFLVEGVERIINLNWEDIKAPPKGLGNNSYMTAVTSSDDQLVEIIDVEKVLAELIGVRADIENANTLTAHDGRTLRLMVVDDSSVARNQIKRTLEQMGIETILANNGKEGLNMLKAMTKQGEVSEQIDMIISDVEMPEMDGYTFTAEIRNDPQLKALPVLLHTSLSGGFNQTMVEKVGADKFVPKFNAEELSSQVKGLLLEKQLITV